MTMIDATVGGTGSNSYVTVSDFDAYMAGRFESSSYVTATDAQRSGSLLQAARILERLTFISQPTTQEQALSFPRFSIKKRDRWDLETENTIPQRIKNAQMEVAYALLAGTYLLNPTPEAMGPTTLEAATFPADKPGAWRRFPPEAAAELRGLTSNPCNFVLVR